MDFLTTDNNDGYYSLQEDISAFQAGEYLETKVGAVTHLQTPADGISEQGEHPQSKAENSNEYRRASADLNSEWRLILCKNGI